MSLMKTQTVKNDPRFRPWSPLDPLRSPKNLDSHLSNAFFKKSKITPSVVKTKLRNQSPSTGAFLPSLKIRVLYPRRLGVSQITSSTLLIFQMVQGLILIDLRPDSQPTIMLGHPLQPATSSLPQPFLRLDLLQLRNVHTNQQLNHSNVTPCVFERIALLGRSKSSTMSQHLNIVNGYNESNIVIFYSLQYGILKLIFRR